MNLSKETILAKRKHATNKYFCEIELSKGSWKDKIIKIQSKQDKRKKKQHTLRAAAKQNDPESGKN